jgi:hypothetical protein
MNGDQTEFCPQCGLEVFTGEKFCSSCGVSLTKGQAAASPNFAEHVPVVRDSMSAQVHKPLPEAKAPKPPSLVGGFIGGFAGGLAQLVGGLCIFPLSFMYISVDERHGGGHGAAFFFFVGIGIIIWGSWMRYASAHAVRISR